jgi:hypothetical protein
VSANGSGDWAASYSQHLARSTALSARTLKLYQEALECVSQGKLAPTVFQDHFTGFAQAHGAEYTRKLTELGARFLGGLVQIGTAYSSQSDSTASAPEAEIPPPRFDAANPMGWFQQVAEYAGQLNARALKAYREQLDRVAAGQTTPSEVQQASSDYLKSQLPRYLQRAGELYFDLLNGLSEIRAKYEEEYFRGVLASANGQDAAPPVVLRLTAPLGEVASASLSITNTTGERTVVRHTVTDVRRADGQGPALIPKLTVTPEELVLGPGQEGSLLISLRCDAAEYDADAPYIGTLRVVGNGDLRVEVQLRITALQAVQA